MSLAAEVTSELERVAVVLNAPSSGSTVSLTNALLVFRTLLVPAVMSV
jgi:hypothetical protein